MTPSRSFRIFATVFAVVFPIVYVVAVEKNYALFTYHPVVNEFGLLAEPPKAGLAMYYYGWLATSGIIAFLAGIIASFAPERMAKRLWSGWSWLVPLAVILVFSYFLRGFFIRYDVSGQGNAVTPSIEQPREGIE